MKVTPIKTDLIVPGKMTVRELLDNSIKELQDGSVLAITSKIISLCENRVESLDADKDELVKQESDYYLPGSFSQYDYHFSIVDNTLVALAGIDESNGDGHYVLYPEDSQKSANEIRRYLMDKFGLQRFGVVVTDSTCSPLRRGTTGIVLAYSGFHGLNDYIGQPDLFGRTMKVSQANVAGGLAATAVLTMGEGREQTPLCLLEDLPFVRFNPGDPSAEELATLLIEPDADLFAPFLKSVDWQQGRHRSQ